MATLAPAPTYRLWTERLFFSGVAIAMLFVTFAGFAPSYYLMRFTAAPELAPIVHVHGLVFSAWMLLYAVQTGLVAGRNIALHRTIGYGAISLAVLVVALGFTTAIVTATPTAIPGRIAPPIIFPFFAVGTFGLLCAAAIALRARPQHHKRLMMLATLSLVVTPGARIGRMIGAALPPPIVGMAITDLFIVALVLFDLKTRGRLHPATIGGGAAFLLSQPLRVAIAALPAWQTFAASQGWR